MTTSKNQHWIITTVFAGLLAGLLFFTFERSIAWLNSWTYTHWLFSYDVGILKRGLVGELLQQINFHPSYHSVYWLAKWNLYLIFGLTAVIVLIPLRKNRLTAGWLLFALALISNPATLQHAADSVARLNNVALLFLLIYMVLMPLLGLLNGTLLLVVTCAASVATHEASFFLVAPFLVAAHFFVHRHHPRALTLSLWGAIAATATLVVITVNSGQTELTDKVYYESLIETYSRVSYPAVKILFTSFEENLRMALAHLFTWSSFLHHSVFLAVIGPILPPLWRCAREIHQGLGERSARERYSLYLLGLSALAPLALYPVGFDHFRWLSASMTIAFFGLALLCREPPFFDIVSRRFRADWHWVAVAATIGWVAGPSADYYSFSWARQWLGMPA